MNHCVLVTVLELASGKPIFFPWDIRTYVYLCLKVPLFLFPGTVTLDSNNHSGLEMCGKYVNVLFALQDIPQTSKDNLDSSFSEN